MRAYIVPEFGAPGSIADQPTPEPGEGEILVRVRAAGVNAMDPIVASGALRDYMEHRLPLVPGIEYAGTIEALGPGVTGLSIGDEVFGAVGKAHMGEGSFAEHATVNAAIAARRPETLPAHLAAAIPIAGGTALAAVDAAAIGEGDTVVIVGAGGGVGTFATQLAARRGARVLAITSEGNVDSLRGLGATECIDRRAGDVVAAVRRFAPDGVAAIIDNVDDAARLVPLAELVRPGGHVVSPLAMGGDQALAGLPVTFHYVQAAVDRASELGELVASGELVVPVETLPLERAGDALARQATREVHGKLVLLVD